MPAGPGTDDENERKSDDVTDSTICKFRCDWVKHSSGYQEVKLLAQYDEALDEDRRFAKATPSGELIAMITNPNLDGFYEPGKTYYLTITPA